MPRRRFGRHLTDENHKSTLCAERLRPNSVTGLQYLSRYLKTTWDLSKTAFQAVVPNWQAQDWQSVSWYSVCEGHIGSPLSHFLSLSKDFPFWGA
jgi:hypothetical protein